MKKYYEFRDAKSTKFWEFELSEDSLDVHIRYGKIGTEGRKQVKSFSSYEDALAHAEKTAASKEKKGYALTESAAGSEVATEEEAEVVQASGTEAKAKVAKAKSAKASSAKAKASKPAPALSDEVVALDALLVSPDLANRELGLTMLEERDPNEHTAALLFLANGMKHQNEYMLEKEELAQRQAIADAAKNISKTLKSVPKDAFQYGEKYAKYIFDDGREPVIRAFIEENLAYNRDGELRISDARLRELPDCVSEYQAIRSVYLMDSAFQEFPPQLLALENLEVVNLYASKIPEIPEILYERDMRVLDLERNKITELTSAVGNWKNLRELDLYVNPITELPDELVLLPELQRLRVEKTGMPGAQVEKLFAHLRESEASEERRLVQWNLVFARTQRALEVGSYPEWVVAMDAVVPLVRANAALCLDAWLASDAAGARATGPKDGDVLAVIGKLTIKTKELKERLAEQGIKVTTKIDGKTTHLAIGEKPGKKLEEAMAWEGPVLTDSRVVALLQAAEKPFLLEEDEDTGEAQKNLGAMLASPDEETVGLALTMMKTSGVPSELKTDLFATYQLSSDKKNKKLAKELLLQVASPALTQVLAKRQNFPAATEKKISEYVETFCADGELDAMRLVVRLLEGNALGIKYALEHGDSAMRLRALRAFQKDGSLDLYDKHVKVLPEEIGELEGLTALRCDHAGLKEIPASIGKLTSLRSLQLGANRLKALPDELANLQELEELDIGGNSFKRVPEVVTQLRALKKLSLGGYDKANPLTSLPDGLSALENLEELSLGYLSLANFPDVLLALPSLAVLRAQGDAISEYPNDLSSWTSLRELHLGSCTFKEIPAGIATLPALERIDLIFADALEDVGAIASLATLRHFRMPWAGRLSEQFAELAERMPNCTFDV